MRNLGTQAAIAFLQQKYPHINITPDNFYHRVYRGSIPCDREEHGKVVRYKFSEEELDQVVFRSPKEHEETPKAYRKRTLWAQWSALFDKPITFWETFQPIKVSSAADIAKLEAEYGELANTQGLLELLHKKFHVQYGAASLKQRRYRGSILAVGWQGDQTRDWWYPIKQVDILSWHPNMAKNRAKN